jgi:carbon storage regulator
MLVLSRKRGERIAIGEAIVVTVLRLSGGRVKLGITAPDDVSVLRTEVDRREDLVYSGIVRPAAFRKASS